MNEQVTEANTNVAAVAALAHYAAVAGSVPKAPSYPDAAPFLVLRDADGKERIEWLKELLPAPDRKRGAVAMLDAESFIAYFKQHTAGAQIYAALEPAQFIGVLNDHTTDKAGYRDHRVTYMVAHSPEWNTWFAHNGVNKAFQSTEELALFLEENALDVIDPSANKMLEIALNFKINNKVAYSSAQRLADGNVDFNYSNVVEAGATSGNGGRVKIPEKFTIEVPVFAALNPKRYKVEARFRFRLRDGSLTLWYELIHPRKAKEQAFKEMLASIAKETKTTILHGTP